MISIIPLFLETFLFYIGKLRNNVRTVPLKNENFIFSWNFGFILAVLPVVLGACDTLFVALPLILVMFAVSLSPAIVQRLELPQISESVASTWLSPSLFWIVYTASVIILPEWFVGFVPFVYFLFSPFSGEKRA